MNETNDQVAAGLGTKLDALDLTTAERDLLHTIVYQAIDAEVAGFGQVRMADVLPGLGFNIGMPPSSLILGEKQTIPRQGALCNNENIPD